MIREPWILTPSFYSYDNTYKHCMDTYATLDTLHELIFDLHPGDRVFLRGPLWAGKSTFARALIQHHIPKLDSEIMSPTYTYYHTYGNLYHFDLYRITQASDLIRIGADEILDDEKTICIIEWPEILGDTIMPTHDIEISIDGEWRMFRKKDVKSY